MTKAKTRHNRSNKDTRRVNVYLPNKLFDAIEKDATKLFDPIGGWIVDACRERLEREK